MRNTTFKIVLAALLVLAVIPANAIQYVNKNATTGTQDGTSWCNAFLTIQAALNIAASGEKVFVAGATGAGTVYTENIVFKTAAILQGGYRGNCAGGPPDTVRDPATYVTVIDGGVNSAGTCTVTGSVNGSIDGFTIRGAESGIYYTSPFTVSNNTVTSGQYGIYYLNSAQTLATGTINANNVSSGTYGIYCVNSSPTITNNIVTGDSTGNIGLYIVTGGVCNGWYAYAYTCTSQVSGNIISGWTGNALRCDSVLQGCYQSALWGNCSPTVNNNQLAGGAAVIYVVYSSPTISNNSVSGGTSGILCDYGAPQIIGNTLWAAGTGQNGVICSAPEYCSGWYVWTGACTAVVSGNSIQGYSIYGVDCWATRASCYQNSGDGICTPTISNNTITGSGVDGVACDCATPTISGNAISNSANYGIYCYNDVDAGASMLALTISGNVISGQLDGIYCHGASTTIQRNVIQLSSAQSILCDGGSASVVEDNMISGGTIGVQCAGTATVPTSPQVLRNIITSQSQTSVLCQNSSSNIKSNVLASAGQYGVDCQGGSPLIYNNTVANNGWYGIEVESGTPAAYNNIITGSPVGFNVDGGAPTLGYNDNWNNATAYSGVNKPATDVSWNPMFLSPAVGEYHLTPDSPCVNAGSNTYVNSAGDKDADGKARILPVGGTVDMGCFELDSTAYWVRSAAQAKVIPSTYSIQMNNNAVSAAWANFFYLEDYDRKSGIRVEMAPDGLTAANQRANVLGVVQTNSAGEQCIEATSVTAVAGSAIITPLGMPGRFVGGGTFQPAGGQGQLGIVGCTGINNIGLLVKVWGKVTSVDTSATPTWFEINDGSALLGAARQIQCVAQGGSPVINTQLAGTVGYVVVGGYVDVTGISSCEFSGASLVSEILMTTYDVIAP